VFETVEAPFDAVALLVELAVVGSLVLSSLARRDDRLGSQAFDLGEDFGAEVSLVGDHHLGLAAFQQIDRLSILGGLAGSEPEGDRQAVPVGQQMDFGRQSTSGTPQSLVFAAPFLRPVAAC